MRGAEQTSPALLDWLILFLGCLLVPAAILLYQQPV